MLKVNNKAFSNIFHEYYNKQKDNIKLHNLTSKEHVPQLNISKVAKRTHIPLKNGKTHTINVSYLYHLIAPNNSGRNITVPVVKGVAKGLGLNEKKRKKFLEKVTYKVGTSNSSDKATDNTSAKTTQSKPSHSGKTSNKSEHVEQLHMHNVKIKKSPEQKAINRINSYLKKKEITQKSLADKMNFDIERLRRHLHGKIPSSFIFIGRVANALNVEPAIFINPPKPVQPKSSETDKQIKAQAMSFFNSPSKPNSENKTKQSKTSTKSESKNDNAKVEPESNSAKPASQSETNLESASAKKSSAKSKTEKASSATSVTSKSAIQNKHDSAKNNDNKSNLVHKSQKDAKNEANALSTLFGKPSALGIKRLREEQKQMLIHKIISHLYRMNYIDLAVVHTTVEHLFASEMYTKKHPQK